MEKSTLKKIEETDELMRKRENGKAVTLIKEALKEEPNNAYCYYLLGTARMKCGRLLLAKKALEKANEIEPRHPSNLRGLGWVKVMLGEIEEGRRYLREAISLDLMDPLPYVDLAMSYFNWFEFDEGMEWLKRGEALAPKEPFVVSTVKMAKKMQKEYSKFSGKQIKKMKDDLANPEYQRAFRVSLLEKTSFKKALTKDEAEEVKEEARLNGFSASIITDKQQAYLSAENKSNSEKIKEILRKRREIEKNLQKMIKETGSDFDLDYIKDIIYNEEGNDELMKIVSVFDRGGDITEIGNILELVNDAWNYFPHKCLKGLCPMEKILECQ